MDGTLGPETVSSLQKFLSAKGFYHGPIGGSLGGATVTALQHFLQREEQLTRIGSAAITKQQPITVAAPKSIGDALYEKAEEIVQLVENKRALSEYMRRPSDLGHLEDCEPRPKLGTPVTLRGIAGAHHGASGTFVEFLPPAKCIVQLEGGRAVVAVKPWNMHTTVYEAGGRGGGGGGGGGCKRYGSVFGLANPERGGPKRYFVDSAGFVRGLIKALKPAVGTLGPDDPRRFFTPHKFAFFFKHRCKKAHEGARAAAAAPPPPPPSASTSTGATVSGANQQQKQIWGRIDNAQSLRPGDIVAWGAVDEAESSHSGHIWLVASRPDRQGYYNIIHCSGRSSPEESSGIQRGKKNIRDIRDTGAIFFGMGRLLQ